jgi:glycosyltransferase involved in cell wall biosynthesis
MMMMLLLLCVDRSIEQSTGEYLCFLDADDIMKPERVELQLQAALKHPDSIIGAKFTRWGSPFLVYLLLLLLLK